MSPKHRISIGFYWSSICVCFCACNYDPQFDTLSAFPANAQRKSIEEIELVKVKSVERDDLSSLQSVAIEPAVKKSKVIEPIAGVKGYPFVGNDSETNDGRFERLEFERTGVEASGLRELNPEDGGLLSTPFCSVGLAVGDLDGDDLPDICVADQFTGCRILGNQGEFRFQDLTDVAGVSQEESWGVSPTLVDINNDGLLDIYLCCYKSPNRLFINKGRKFSEQSQRYGLDFEGASAAASFSDFDRDGDLDLYLVTHRLPPANIPDKLPVNREPGKPPRIEERYREANHLIAIKDGGYVPVESGQYDRVFTNNGTRFVDVTDDGLFDKQPYRGNSARWLDFDEDGWPDLYVANDGKDPDQLFRNLGLDNEGSVRFEDVANDFLSSNTWFAKASAVLDLDADGRLDLLVAGNADQSTIRRVNRRGNVLANSVDAWFLNGASPAQTFANVAYLNVGFGPFYEMARVLGLGHAGDCSAVCSCDFDNDGQQEIWFGNGAVRTFLDNDLNQQLGEIKTGDKAKRTAAFWMASKMDMQLDAVFRFNGDGDYEFVSRSWGIEDRNITRSVVSSDLDNDGDADVLTVDLNGEVSIYKNKLAVGNSIELVLRGQNGNASGMGAVVRLTVDENSRSSVRYVSNSGAFLGATDPKVRFGIGAANSARKLEITWPSGSKQSIANVPANYRYVVTEKKVSRSVGRGLKLNLGQKLFAREAIDLETLQQQELEFDDFEKQPLLPFRLSQMGPGHAWGDVDNDGDDDLFVGGAAFEKSQLFVNEGDFQFELAKTTAFDGDVRCEDTGCVFFDCDGDGDLDLYVASGGVESKLDSSAMQDRLYLNNGRGDFEKSKDRLPAIPTSGGAVSVADFNKDGKLDVFVGGRVVPGEYPAKPKSTLLINSSDGFKNQTTDVANGLESVGMVTGSVWIDVDGDNRLDLMVATQYGSTHCFQSVNGKLIDVSEKSGLSTVTGLFNSIAAGDVDNDGDTDFVVGNLGTNTVYSASDSMPLWLHSTENTQSGESFLVEAFTGEDGQQHAMRSRDLLRKHITSFPMSIKNSQKFTEMSMQEWLDKAGLETTRSLSVNCLESGVWFNDSVGGSIKFRFEPLPNIAQNSPIIGVELVDFNGDGNLDLVATQNSDQVHPDTEEFMAGQGLVLVGDGTGGFARPTTDSGVQLRGNGRSLTVADLNSDGRCDLIAASNGENMKFFSNQSRHLPFAIDLRRVSDGKNVVGAKIILEFADGGRQLHQVVSGSGYLSHSPPVVYSGLKNKKDIESVTIVWPDGTTKTGSADNLLRQR